MTSDCNLTTICDIEAERQCRSKLKHFAHQTIRFTDEIKAFLELEKTKVNKMWQLSVKTKLLLADTPPMYPSDVTEAVLREVVSDLNEMINEHGMKLNDCETELQALQRSHRAFTTSCFSLDWNLDLEIITGNEYQKPLKYFMNAGDDVISQTKLVLINLRTAFDAIEMNDSLSFENYSKSFVIADDFLNLLNEFLVFCNIYLKYS